MRYIDERVNSKKLKKDNRKLKKYLKLLSTTVSVNLYIIDKTIGKDINIPKNVSKQLGRITNRLDLANDQVRHFIFGLDITQEGKERYAKKFIKQTGVD